MKTLVFAISLLVISSICYADDIINSYESDVMYTDIETNSDRIISSSTIIKEENCNSNIKQLIKEKIIPDQTDVFESNHTAIESNKKNHTVITNNSNKVKSPRPVAGVRK